MMTITDAAGDFLAYKVKLVSLQLKKSDGTLVETLPASTTVDFAQLIDLSEILSARQIPPGDYVAAQVTVDFTGATIMVDDGTGTGVAVKPVDSSGAALGQLQLMVQLDNKNDLKINAAKASRIAFDFNLLASNMVDLTAKTDTVSPTLVASVVPIDNKQIRVRGEISAVDAANSDYTINVDPFHDNDGNKLSPLVVHTTDSTTFEINGKPFAGAAGLAQLATLPADTIAVAFGNLQAGDQTFTATSVLAGSSAEGGGFDHVVGNVVARNGNTLTIHGARMDGHGGGDNDDDEFIAGNSTVNVAAATAVTADGQSSATPAHTIAEISVGSLIDAFGTATKDNSGKVTLDASAGRVRLDLTRVQGSLRGSATGDITLNLKSIDRQPISLFSFTGTGSGVDTDPTKYVVATGALNVSSFSVGELVLSIGFVNPFGKAPPDFNAVTVAGVAMGGNDNCDNNNCMCPDNSGSGDGNDNCVCNGSSGGSGSNNCMCNGDGMNDGSGNCMCSGDGMNDGNGSCMCNGDGNGDGSGSGDNNCPNNGANGAASAELDIDWGNSGTAKPFKSLTASALDLDVTNGSIGSNHEIETNPQNIDLKSLATDVSIMGAGSGMTLFSITGQHGRETRNFGSFADFEAALAADLDGTTTALRLTAEGMYDAASNTFTAQRITILLSN
ncbi:MAG TPA: hypothetical protein VE058_14450 [Steroidobacteraceae bacterium]|nr:hypothetical protein [Steroidobacteraceae bacterium]